MTNLPNVKVALVTGANRGIGYAVARQLALNDFKVILTSRVPAKGQDATEHLKDEGLDVIYHELDVTDPASVAQLKRWVTDKFDRLDVLVNNAGVYLDEGNLLLDVDDEIVYRTLDVNLMGTYRMCKAFVPMMVTNSYGRVINLSSGYGAMDAMSARTGSYKISKLGINGLTRILADEVDESQVKINAVDPGWVHTEMGGPSAPRTPEQAADTIVWLAMADEYGESGKFWFDRQKRDW